MKFFARAAALGVAAVFSAAIASATTYTFGSYATNAANMGNQNSAMVFDTVNSTPNSGVVYTPATVTLLPGLWAGPLAHSTWVSFGQTGPTTPAGSEPGGHYAANGDYFFTTTFTLDAQATSFSFSVLADDTTAVYLDGQTGDALFKPSSGNNTICNTNLPNCTEVDTITGVDSPAVLALLTAGTHTWTFDVKQIQSAYMGVDFSATVTTGSAVPEPSSLLLLGSGLIGAAGTLLRRARIAAR